MQQLSIYLAAMVLAGAGPAFGYCAEPSAPACATRYGSFDDQDDFERCRRQMISYRSDVEQFVSCQNDEIRKARSAAEDALQEYESMVERFNRRAKR